MSVSSSSMRAAHVLPLPGEENSAPESHAVTARARYLRRERMPGRLQATRTASFLLNLHLRIHSSERRLAKLLGVSKTRVRALADLDEPQTITLADLVQLGLSQEGEARAIASGILRDVAAYVAPTEGDDAPRSDRHEVARELRAIVRRHV